MADKPQNIAVDWYKGAYMLASGGKLPRPHTIALKLVEELVELMSASGIPLADVKKAFDKAYEREKARSSLFPTYDRGQALGELADNAICLQILGGLLGIDVPEVSQAMINKIHINFRRTWKLNEDGTMSHVPGINAFDEPNGTQPSDAIFDGDKQHEEEPKAP